MRRSMQPLATHGVVSIRVLLPSLLPALLPSSLALAFLDVFPSLASFASLVVALVGTVGLSFAPVLAPLALTTPLALVFRTATLVAAPFELEAASDPSASA